MSRSALPCLVVAALTLTATFSLAPRTAAQRHPATDPPTAMLHTQQGLYVLRGDTVYRLDPISLEVRAVRRLPAPADVVGELEAAEEVVEIEEIDELEVPGRDPEDEGVHDQRLAKTVADGLAWLLAHQDEDGKWDADGFMKHAGEDAPCTGPGQPVHDVAGTGLSLLVLLADGNTLRAGEHHDHVKRAVKWLLEQQDPQTGLIGKPIANDFIYDHAIATLALIECYGLSDSAVLKKHAQRAIDYLEYHRNPYNVWRYQPRSGDADTSVTTWAVLAYRSGIDFGLTVNRQALELATTWYLSMTDPTTGRSGYSERGGWSSRPPGDAATRFPRDKNEAMTAAALFGLHLITEPEEHAELKELQARLIANKPPRWDPEAGAVDAVAWYFGSQALYQTGGVPWRHWAPQLERALHDGQRTEGHAAGSWDPAGPWGHTGGRVYMTALLTLAGQVQLRHQRMKRR